MMKNLYKKIFLFALLFGFVSRQSNAQEPDFEAFLSKFPPASLPYSIAVDGSHKDKKSLAVSKQEAKDFLTGFDNANGQPVDHYSTLIEPFGPKKDQEGHVILAKAKAYKVALLQRTENYALVLIHLVFVEKNLETMEGEQYLLHSFESSGQPLTTVPIAQKIQFDFHSNQVSGKIDAEGNITTLVEVFAPSGDQKFKEKYKIKEDGVIEEVKD